MPNAELCPVSQIRFVKAGTELPSATQTIQNYDSNEDIVITRGGDPLVDVVIREGRVCLNQEELPSTPNRLEFKFFKKQRKPCS